MPCASRSPGATASIISGTLLPDRCTTQAPASTPNGIAPQMPSPPSQTAAKPYQCAWIVGILVPAREVVVEAGADDAGDDAPERHAEDEIPVPAPASPSGGRSARCRRRCRAAASRRTCGGETADEVERAARRRRDVAEDEAGHEHALCPRRRETVRSTQDADGELDRAAALDELDRLVEIDVRAGPRAPRRRRPRSPRA